MAWVSNSAQENRQTAARKTVKRKKVQGRRERGEKKGQIWQRIGLGCAQGARVIFRGRVQKPHALQVSFSVVKSRSLNRFQGGGDSAGVAVTAFPGAVHTGPSEIAEFGNVDARPHGLQDPDGRNWRSLGCHDCHMLQDEQN